MVSKRVTKKNKRQADKEWYESKQRDALWELEKIEQGLEEMFRRQAKRGVIV